MIDSFEDFLKTTTYSVDDEGKTVNMRRKIGGVFNVGICMSDLENCYEAAKTQGEEQIHIMKKHLKIAIVEYRKTRITRDHTALDIFFNKIYNYYELDKVEIVYIANAQTWEE